MPPRFVYWTILAGGMPTAFRAADRDELLPTFHRLREKHPDAEMKYFAQGKLWNSPEEARAARAPAPPGGPAERRGRDWRPGGSHRDPRQKFVDQKKARNQRWRQDKFERRQETPREKPHGDPLRRDPRFTAPAAPRREWKERPPGHSSRPANSSHGGNTSRPGSFSRPPGNWRDGAPREKPHGDRMRDEVQKDWRGRSKEDWRAPREKRWGQDRDDRPNRGPRPDREPRRGDEDPKHPPRPSEPRIEPPGPPERGSRPGGSKRPFFKRDSGRPHGGKPPRGRK